MTSIDSNVYPQMVTGQPAGALPAEVDVRGPAVFQYGENVIFMRPEQVIAWAADGNTVRFTCQTRGYRNKTAQTHETRMHQFERLADCAGEMTVEVQVWSASTFRVRFSDEALPQQEPGFPPAKARMLVGKPEPGVKLCVKEEAGYVRITTDECVISVDRATFAMQARDKQGRLFWKQKRTDLFTADIFDISVARHAGKAGSFESFALDGQEQIYGLGERFDHVERTGKLVDFWNKDAIGTSSRRTYINVPFLLSTRGYGLFVNSSCRMDWEVGTLDGATLGFATEDGLMDYFIIYGPRPADILYKYSLLTGFSPTPPVWSFGLWMSRNSYESWAVVHDVARGMRERGIPADVLHLDTYWFQEDWNTDLRFATDRFANPAENMRQLRDEGFRVSLWQYNFVPPRPNNVNYVEGLQKGYFVKGRDGKPYAYPAGTTGSWVDDCIIDFSNPDASAWYTEQIKRLIRMGAATIKTDFGEGVPEDGVYQSIDGRRFHNLYALVYNAAIAEAIYEVSGEHVVWARSGTAGSQRYPLHWGGDSQCSWAGLAGTLRAALSIGLSGFPFFSHDIGGFIGRPTPELYIRWAQFGLFSSHSRCHGAGNDNSREPWSFGEDANRIFKQYAQLRYSLLPYIYHQARQCSRTAKPMVRALVIDYPDDPNVRYIEDQYLFGDSLLVAPVLAPLDECQSRMIYLPAGTWFDYWTKQARQSRGEWLEYALDLQTLPIFVKEGSILPYGEEKQSTNNQIGRIARLETYGDEGSLAYDDGEKRFRVTLHDGKATIDGLSDQPPVRHFGA
jgi:alpha-D-xyloside xylohydrolase